MHGMTHSPTKMVQKKKKKKNIALLDLFSTYKDS